MRLRARPGVSFVELVAIGCMVAMALIPVIGSFQSGFLILRRQEGHHAAIALARQAVAFCRAHVTEPGTATLELQGQPIVLPWTFTCPLVAGDPAAVLTDLPVAPPGFEYAVAFENPGSSATPLLNAPADPELQDAVGSKLVKVTVEVRWGGGVSPNRLRLCTLLANTHGY